MRKFKILLLGITGDLSKRKVLPAISQFAHFNKNKVEVDLIGYSRSQPEESEIERILLDNSENENSLNSIEFVQGEYTDPSFFIKTVENLKNKETLIVYLAIPPVAFLQLLDTFCPYGSNNLHIIMEKPFGENLEDAKKILKKIEECKLESNVHFFDHYLFKTSSIAGSELLSQDKKLTSQKIKEISIKALESLSLENRAGYYEGVGALKDFFPSHMISLLKLTLDSLNLEINFDTLQIEKYQIGQYDDYLNDLGRENSSTETYFYISAKSDNFTVKFESGKKLKEKATEIKVEFQSGDVLVWNIDPEKLIKFRAKESSLLKNKNLDHTNMFEDILNHKIDKFVTFDDVLNGWKVYDLVNKFKEEARIPLQIYSGSEYPVNFLT